MKSIYSELGNGIRTKRLQLGLTLEDLGELSDLHASYIGQIERDSKKASLATVAALAKALGVPVGHLFSCHAQKPNIRFGEQLDAILRTTSGVRRNLILDVLRQLSKSLRKLR